jgi:nucleotide-binding universal stress UspA family protein
LGVVTVSFLAPAGTTRSMAPRRILLGVDGTKGAVRAAHWTAELGHDLGAKVVVVHVVSEAWLMELSALQFNADELVRRARAELVGPWTQPLRDAEVQYLTELVRGDPASELLRIADERNVDLIVIGGTHHSGLRGAILGGTAHRVVNHSLRPVTVVPLEPSRTRSAMPPLPG